MVTWKTRSNSRDPCDVSRAGRPDGVSTEARRGASHPTRLWVADRSLADASRASQVPHRCLTGASQVRNGFPTGVPRVPQCPGNVSWAVRCLAKGPRNPTDQCLYESPCSYVSPTALSTCWPRLYSLVLIGAKIASAAAPPLVHTGRDRSGFYSGPGEPSSGRPGRLRSVIISAMPKHRNAIQTGSVPLRRKQIQAHFSNKNAHIFI